MGNVSHFLPAIHPSIGVLGAAHAPHTRGFADDCATPAADDAVLAAAAALARTVADVAAAAGARAEYLRRQAARGPYAEPSPG